MRLILIRHAESIHAQSDIIAWLRGCPGLTARGFEQAHHLAGYIHAARLFQDCSVLLTSPAARARQTAEALLPVLPVTALIEDSGLTENLPGEADGMTRSAYQAAYGKFNPQDEPDRPFSPGGESWNQFIQRASATPQRLADQYPNQTVVAVTHAGLIVVSFLYLFAIPLLSTRARIDPDYTGITEWEYEGSNWRLVGYNDRPANYRLSE